MTVVKQKIDLVKEIVEIRALLGDFYLSRGYTLPILMGQHPRTRYFCKTHLPDAAFKEWTSMWTRTIAVSILSFCAGCPGTLQGQQKPAVSSPSGAREFPVVMRQNVTAGKTPAGTKVQAQLQVATLIEGNVIPRNAIFSGEVIESTAKSATGPSRVGIRLDAVKWKNGSAAVKVYLTTWYYPDRNATGQGLDYGPQQPANRTWNGQGQYPDPNSKVYRPFPGSDSDKSASVPDTPSSSTSNRRVRMKDVETQSSNDGAIAIVCNSANLKLDKLTTYVFAGGEETPAK
jgi:hypothetical protein